MYSSSQGVPVGSGPIGGSAPNYSMPQMQPVVVTSQPQVVTVGNCPTCRNGMLESDFTVCGIIWAVLCFPVGLLCCLLMRQKRCSNCGSTFS